MVLEMKEGGISPEILMKKSTFFFSAIKYVLVSVVNKSWFSVVLFSVFELFAIRCQSYSYVVF